MKTGKKLLSLLLILLTASALFACAEEKPLTSLTEEMTETQAKYFVQMRLDYAYKGTADENYLTLMGVTSDDMANFHASTEVTDFSLIKRRCAVERYDDEFQANVNEVLRNMFSYVSYTVGEATENEDGSFSVAVNVKPITFFTTIEEKLDTKRDKFLSKYTEYEIATMSKSAYEKYCNKYNALVLEAVNEAYGEISVSEEEKTVNIIVKKSDEGKWTYTKDSLTEFKNTLFVY
ncbi:MAG: hypothetical protein IKM61_03980 [Eubacteriaceae bacterium]|nr:hypothetical protein [Eubacteriaceae bacterium]